MATKKGQKQSKTCIFYLTKEPGTFWHIKLWKPIYEILRRIPILGSRGDRPLQMNFEDHLKSLVYFHLEEHPSGQHLLQVLDEDDYARKHIAPEAGIKKSSFSEAMNNRGSMLNRVGKTHFSY